jgi:hypothetical protein
MNISTHRDYAVQLAQLTVVIRELSTLQAVCRKNDWEFRAGQRTFRWFGRWLEPVPPPLSPSWGRCAHAIGIPGCCYEIGLVHEDDHYLLHWDKGPEGGLETALGPECRRLWHGYIVEQVRRSAKQHGHRAGTPIVVNQVLRVRVSDPRTQCNAHVRVSGAAKTTLCTFGPGAWEVYRYLADALGLIQFLANGEAHDPASC